MANSFGEAIVESAPSSVAAAPSPAPAPTSPTSGGNSFGEPVPDPVKSGTALPGDSHPPPHEEYTQDQANLDAGAYSSGPIVPYGSFSKHMAQGIEKAAVGVAGLPADLLTGFSKDIAYDDQGNVIGSKPDVTSAPPSFMTSPWIMKKLEGTPVDPNKLPVSSAQDQIAEGAGGLLFNLPLLAVGGPEAEIAKEAPVASSAFMRWLGSTTKGAASGGAGAAVETPGDLSERAQAGAAGAAVGGTLGAAVGPVTSGLSWLGNRLRGIPIEGMPKNVSPANATAAGRTLADNLGPEGVAKIDAAVADKPNQTPGYNATIGQIVPNNDKIVQMEQQARTANKGAFTANADAQSKSEIDAIDAQGGTGDAATVGAQLKVGQTAVTDQGKIDADAARNVQRTALSQTPQPAFTDVPAGGTSPPVTAPEAYGADTRAAILTEKQKLSDQVGSLEKTVNADGNVVVPTQSVKNTLDSTYKLNPSAKAPDGNEAEIVDTMKGWGANTPLLDIDTMRTRIANEIDKRIKDGSTSASPDVVRMQKLKQGLDQSIEDGAQVAGTAPSIQAPTSPLDQPPATAPASKPSPPVTPLEGAKRAPQDLVGFLIQQGGVIDQTGDIAAMGGDAIHHKSAGRLINPKGITPDYAREAAEQAGYLRPNSTVNDLYDAIGEQVSGRPVYTQSEQAEGMLAKQASSQQARQDNRYWQAREKVGQVEDRTGVKLNSDDADAAAKLVSQGMSPEDAHRSVITSREDLELQRNAQHNAVGSPGLPLAEQMNLSLPGGNAAMPANPRYFTPDEITARGQIKDLKTQLAQNYSGGSVGDILAYGESSSGAKNIVPEISRTRGGFNTTDADVMSKIWDGTRNENANIQQFQKAGGDLDNLKSWAADDLRQNAVDPITGDLDPAKYAKWRRDHRAGLNSAPELKGAFDGVDAAQQTMQAVAESNAAKLADYNSQAVSHFLGNNPETAVKSMFENGLSGDNTRDVLGKLGNDPAANAGLRRAVGDYVGDRYQPLTQTGSTINDAAKAKDFNGFLTKNKDALTQLYGEDGYKQFQQIGKQMTDRSSNASSALRSAPPGAGGPSGGPGHGLTGKLLVAEIGAEAIKHTINAAADVIPGAKPIGMAIGGAAWIGSRIRSAGIKTQGQLLNLSALNPTTVGKQLLDISARYNDTIAPQMSRRLAAAIGAATQDQQARQSSAQ